MSFEFRSKPKNSVKNGHSSESGLIAKDVFEMSCSGRQNLFVVNLRSITATTHAFLHPLLTDAWVWKLPMCPSNHMTKISTMNVQTKLPSVSIPHNVNVRNLTWNNTFVGISELCGEKSSIKSSFCCDFIVLFT